MALGVDIRGVWAPYRGPKLHADIPERGVQVDDWGIHRRWIEHERLSYPAVQLPLAVLDPRRVLGGPTTLMIRKKSTLLDLIGARTS